MECFDNHGHLTDQALRALVREAPLEELERLEIAEHLAFCDRCLQRYTQLLTDDALLTPSPACREGLRRRIRRRLVHIFTSRYATAAAAVVLALTLLWSGMGLGNRPRTQEEPRPLVQAGTALTEWAAAWPQRFQDAFSGLAGLLDHLGDTPNTTQGGTHP